MLEVSKKCKISVKGCENWKIYSFFALPMKKILITILYSCLVISFVTAQSDNEKDFNERSLIALRAVGHQLMMGNNDSTSIIKPKKHMNYHLIPS